MIKPHSFPPNGLPLELVCQKNVVVIWMDVAPQTMEFGYWTAASHNRSCALTLTSLGWWAHSYFVIQHGVTAFHLARVGEQYRRGGNQTSNRRFTVAQISAPFLRNKMPFSLTKTLQSCKSAEMMGFTITRSIFCWGKLFSIIFLFCRVEWCLCLSAKSRQIKCNATGF